MFVDHQGCLYISAIDEAATADKDDVVCPLAAREESLPFSSPTITSSMESRCGNLIGAALLHCTSIINRYPAVTRFLVTIIQIFFGVQ